MAAGEYAHDTQARMIESIDLIGLLVGSDDYHDVLKLNSISGKNAYEAWKILDGVRYDAGIVYDIDIVEHDEEFDRTDPDDVIPAIEYVIEKLEGIDDEPFMDEFGDKVDEAAAMLRDEIGEGE